MSVFIGYLELIN